MSEDPILSPDGKYMWTGSEWIPAPPNSNSNPSQQPLESSTHTESEQATFDHIQHPNTVTAQYNDALLEREVSDKLNQIQEFTNFLETCIFKRPKYQTGIAWMSVFAPYPVGGIIASGYWLLVVLNGYWWYGFELWLAPVSFITSITVSFFLIRGIWQNRRKMKSYIHEETGLSPELMKRKNLAIRFNEIVAHYNFLMAVSDSTQDLALRSQLSEHESKLTRLQKRISLQERNQMILTSAAAGAVAYGVTRKLTNNK